MTSSTDISIPLFQGYILRISDRQDELHDYPTSLLPKGFLLLCDGKDLAEEAVGFGFPVVKQGLVTIFPGSIQLSCDQRNTTWKVSALYKLNKVEKVFRAGIGGIRNKLLYTLKNFLAATIRHSVLLRGLLTGLSSIMRSRLGLITAYEDSGFSAEITILYTVQQETGKVEIEVDTTGLPETITEVMVMNEQGARNFDTYMDSSGVCLHGKEIGCWDKVRVAEARFQDKTHGVEFKLGQAEGAKLFRGRELVGSRLAWAGFGYSFPASIKKFSFELNLERLA